MAKTIAAVAVLAGSASAFAPTAMPLRAQRTGVSAMNMQAEQVSRRSVLEGAALAALAAPVAANAVGEGPSNTFSGQNGIATKTANGLLGTSIVGVGKNGAPKVGRRWLIRLCWLTKLAGQELRSHDHHL
eukprot:763266-Hanusia_phi.AAC.4